MKYLEDNEEQNDNFNILQYSYDLVEDELSRSYEKRDRIPSGSLTTYASGDIVYIARHFVSDKARKMRHPYYGPFRVKQVTGNSTKLVSLATGKEKSYLREI